MSARTTATGLAVAGLVGLGLLVVPTMAGAQPQLPPVTPEELVTSVLTAEPGPFAGTVEADNALGLPALPNLPQATDGTSAVRVWSDGPGRGRVQLPGPESERLLVSDGTTFWSWDSETREVVTGPAGAARNDPPASDPATAAAELLGRLQSTSTVSVDGTAEVAGRSAYELVLAPRPSERTLLREVRIAVDAQSRLPLRLAVLGNGSADPALELAFTEITFGPQDPGLFTFTPPPGSTTRQADSAPAPGPDREGSVRAVGDGWDTVYVAERAPGGGGADVPDLGTPVSGAWGSGRLITSAVGSVIVADDGRVAAGAVPEPVLGEALAQ